MDRLLDDLQWFWPAAQSLLPTGRRPWVRAGSWPNHILQNATRFGVSADEDQERLPTFYWLPKLHKQPYKSRFVANSSSCTTTELSKLLTSCLTSIKNHVIINCEKSMKDPVKISFGQPKIHVGL